MAAGDRKVSDFGQYARNLQQYFPSGTIPASAVPAVYSALSSNAFGASQQLNPTQQNALALLSQAGAQAQAAGQTTGQSGGGTSGGAQAGSYYGGGFSGFNWAPVAGLPTLSSIGSQLTPALYQNIANQIAGGAQGAVTINGKRYSINPTTAQTIMGQYGPQPSTTTAPPTPTYGAGGTPFPEQTALSQMAQIDPQSEALRQQLATSYATPLSQATGAPDAAMLQSYLTAYKNLDPQSYATMQALGQQVGGDLALGSTLDPTTQIQIQQAARAAQGARGNVYGVAPAVQEAMTQGQAGLALRQQRQQAAQSYLASGLTPGQTALSLYQQQLGNLRQAQAGATSYLGSGQTPYQAGAGYLANAINMGSQASAGGPVYQPTGITQSPSPYSYLNPTYGLSVGQQANQMYNSMLQSYGMQQAGAGPNRGMGAAAGALGGAASGALMGAAAGGVGAIPGALIGAVGGAASGYFG